MDDAEVFEPLDNENFNSEKATHNSGESTGKLNNNIIIIVAIISIISC